MPHTRMQHGWRHSLAIAVLALGVHATTAFGDQRQRFPIDLNELRAEAEQRFDAADANNDGSVVVEEFLTFMAAAPNSRHGRHGREARSWGAGREGVFDEADSNDDGQLSEQEFEALPDAVRRLRLQKLFEQRDRNDDGALSSAEFSPRLSRFEALDADDDGFVSRAEMPRRRPHRERP